MQVSWCGRFHPRCATTERWCQVKTRSIQRAFHHQSIESIRNLNDLSQSETKVPMIQETRRRFLTSTWHSWRRRRCADQKHRRGSKHPADTSPKVTETVPLEGLLLGALRSSIRLTPDKSHLAELSYVLQRTSQKCSSVLSYNQVEATWSEDFQNARCTPENRS